MWATAIGILFLAPLNAAYSAWPMHIIDNSSQGADGVRLNYFNRDDLQDIVTGWEEGGEVRIAIHPGHNSAKDIWRSFSVGKVASPEDAVMVDLDGDGWRDVVSCTEGNDRTVYVHWNPGANSTVAWKTEPVPALAGKSAWMFCLPMKITTGDKIDLVIGSKNPNGQIGWLETSPTPRNLNKWKWHKLRTTGWTMSLIAEDMDGDGDEDILFSDRKGDATGVYWLERTKDLKAWPEHEIGLRGREVMFISTGDSDHDRDNDIVAAVKPREIVLFVRDGPTGTKWTPESITYSDSFGTAKAACLHDIDKDEQQDVVVSCEQAENASGVLWLSRNPTRTWSEHDIAGPLGIKYDLLNTIDLDDDGDADILTCEEREINAVIWYENPLVQVVRATPTH